MKVIDVALKLPNLLDARFWEWTTDILSRIGISWQTRKCPIGKKEDRRVQKGWGRADTGDGVSGKWEIMAPRPARVSTALTAQTYCNLHKYSTQSPLKAQHNMTAEQWTCCTLNVKHSQQPRYVWVEWLKPRKLTWNGKYSFNSVTLYSSDKSSLRCL